MSNPKVTVPAEMPPEAPAELLAKREPLIANLEAVAKTATGTLQQVLRKTATLLGSTKPGGPFNLQQFQDVKDAFQRFSQDPAFTNQVTPPILMEAVDWMQTYLSSRGFGAQGAGAPAAAAAAPAGKPAAGGAKGGKDSFESTGAPRVNFSPDTPPTEAQKQQQEQLESIKNWKMNPGLGKVKG